MSGSTATVMVVNPASANGKTARQWPEIARRAQELGLDVDVRLTEQAGHAVELAREAASTGAQLVVAVGGDGTVSEVANGLVEAGTDHSCEMAVIARGSGCDFIRTFAIPKNTEKASGRCPQRHHPPDRRRQDRVHGPRRRARARGTSRTSPARA